MKPFSRLSPTIFTLVRSTGLSTRDEFSIIPDENDKTALDECGCGCAMYDA
jgi:hypothetical protein